MNRVVVTLFLLCVFALGSTSVVAQQTDEQVEVKLMLVDALVVDESGAFVSGLSKDDFQMSVDGTIKRLDTLDEICAKDGKPVPGPAPRIALAFDYYQMQQRDRRQIVAAAAKLLREQKKPGEQVMIASLTNVLRVEQRFTDDLDALLDTLERMEYDNTLATQNFDHLSAKQYFASYATLLDVLAAYDGSKAVILYSAAVTAPDDRAATAARAKYDDPLYRDLTTRAAIGRTVIYPAGLGELRTQNPLVGDRVVARLASDTGGNVGGIGWDAAKLYTEVQRELSCRYSLGFYLETGAEQAPEDVRLAIRRKGVKARFPAQVKFWSAEQTRESRTRAAFADPTPFENPLVRAVAYPAGPDSTTTWSTLVAIHAPMPVGPEGETLNVAAELFRDGRKVADFSRQIEFEAGASVQPFTLFGEASVKPGVHELRVAFSKADEKRIVSSEARFELPEVPLGKLMLRGPMLARVEKDGRAIRANESTGVLLKQVIGDQSFEPLTVHEIRPADTLLVGWQACRVKKQDRLESGARVERVVVDQAGNAVHELPSVLLNLESTGGAVDCHRGLDKIEAGTLEPGDYTVEVAITRAGERVLEESTPLLVD